MVEKLCRTGQIRVDSARVKPNVKLFPNQLIRIPNFIRYNNKKLDKTFTKKSTDLLLYFAARSKNIEYLNKFYPTYQLS